jgi:hypothetical protein
VSSFRVLVQFRITTFLLGYYFSGLVFFRLILNRKDDLLKIFQCNYNCLCNLFACFKYPPVECNHSFCGRLYMERGWVRLEGKKYHSKFPSSGFYFGRRINLQ